MSWLLFCTNQRRVHSQLRIDGAFLPFQGKKDVTNHNGPWNMLWYIWYCIMKQVNFCSGLLQRRERETDKKKTERGRSVWAEVLILFSEEWYGCPSSLSSRHQPISMQITTSRFSFYYSCRSCIIMTGDRERCAGAGWQSLRGELYRETHWRTGLSKWVIDLSNNIIYS